MKPRKKRRHLDPIDYWDSLADAMLALFLCILLVVLLFVLYFVQIDQFGAHVDDDVGANVQNIIVYGKDEADESAEKEHPLDEEEDHEHDAKAEQQQQNTASSGGGGNGESRHEDSRPRVRETYERSGDEDEEGEKSAVLVKVVDGETLLPLARDGIEFELYDGRSRLLSLYDYYPERVEQTSFETTINGQFYLPEKVHKGDYMLRALSEVTGYDLAQDTYFSVDRYYDWDEPFEVIVKMFPLRSSVHIELVDKKSGEALTNASFQVVAAENIMTLDGNIRYHAGDVVDTVMLDATGTGDSKELYFGKYLLRQELVPDFYGLLTEDVRVELKEKTAVNKTIRAEKTAMVLTIRDALYDDVTIPGAEFAVTGGVDSSESVVSDDAGQILLTNLQKETTYRIVQTAAATDYRMDPMEHSFTVDGSGLIQGKVRQQMTIENRMTRASFQVSGTLLGNQMSDIRMTLADQNGNVVEQWTTSGNDVLITGLEPGTYHLMIGSDLDHPIEIYISDEAGIQEFRYSRWTLMDTGIVLVLGVLLVGAILIFFTIRRNRKRSGKGATK